MLTVTEATIFDVAIPFRFDFRHALAARDESAGIVLRLTEALGRVGYGECAPREYVTEESCDSVVAALRDELLPRAFCAPFSSFDDVVATLGQTLDGPEKKARPAAHCAFELALLDLAGKVFSRSAGTVVGENAASEIRYGGVVPSESIESSRALCQAIRDAGLVDAKLKVGVDPSGDERLVAEARAILGPRCSIRVDANGAWTAEEALRRIETLARHGIDAVEQPVSAGDLEGWIWLKARTPVPLIADESLVSIEDGHRLVESGACHGFNLRISKCGGLIASRRLRDLAEDAGLFWMLGCQVGETAILSAAGRQFATRSAGRQRAGDRSTYFEGCYGTWLLEEDIGPGDMTLGAGGRGRPLYGNGLGIEVDEERLSRFSRLRQSMVASGVR